MELLYYIINSREYITDTHLCLKVFWLIKYILKVTLATSQQERMSLQVEPRLSKMMSRNFYNKYFLIVEHVIDHLLF